ncbi:phosphoribosylamine--glycine ligase [Actinomyces sp. zg-332]|uniref:phosphoribosylamine--glycine ligase n=1 Tax=Actinomyces sp. zg-332 TaxID=2708340 RepID=UPI00141F842E|nr:phosphoribosylamine--glycine ligase [Actinomyces sp. zg-332]QPK93748.1 phosphoribosylamine--glycine ligase [Actinomyces sp. zg-332]
MKVLVIGSGGREHAIVWKISQSPRVEKIYVAPGNDGMNDLAERVDIPVENIEELADFAKNNAVDITVVGPEIPLTLGIVDEFEKRGCACFGPSKLAAQLEGSKAFAKDLMHKYNIPTAKYGVFTDIELAEKFVDEIGIPCVIKADGLAAGKGVVICKTRQDATNALEEILVSNVFGNAGNKVLIEEFLVGEEVSILAFSDGKTVIPMVSSQDHKRIFDNDLGPNTGGMGAYSPAPVYTEEVQSFTQKYILEATIEAMRKEGIPFKGVLYAGLMVTKDGVKVLEYNARFGDPETQPVLYRLDTDLVDIVEAVVEEKLGSIDVKWKEEPAVCVILASKGYPASSSKGDVISGLEKIGNPNSFVFHSGTRINSDGNYESNGGRVLGVTSVGKTLQEAINTVYGLVSNISFEGMQYRKDIGAKALDRTSDIHSTGGSL